MLHHTPESQFNQPHKNPINAPSSGTIRFGAQSEARAQPLTEVIQPSPPAAHRTGDGRRRRAAPEPPLASHAPGPDPRTPLLDPGL